MTIERNAETDNNALHAATFVPEGPAKERKPRRSPSQRAQDAVDRQEQKLKEAKRRAQQARLRDCIQHLQAASDALFAGDTPFDEDILNVTDAIAKGLREAGQ